MAGSLIAHRMLDVLPMAALVVAVVAGAPLSGHLRLVALVTLGVVSALVVAGTVAARHGHHGLRSSGHVARLVAFGRECLSVLTAPRSVLAAGLWQVAGLGAQLAAVDFSLRAFGLRPGPRD